MNEEQIQSIITECQSKGFTATVDRSGGHAVIMFDPTR